MNDLVRKLRTLVCPFSNHYECKFKINDISYSSVEQYFTSQAASFFKDKETEDMIMQQTDPAKHRRSFKNIKGYDTKLWLGENAKSVMKKAIYAKFSQDDKLRKTILDTGDKEIAEANLSDLYWGTGIALWAQNVAEKSEWKGKNFFLACYYLSDILIYRVS